MMSRKSSGSCVDARLDSYDVKVSCEDSSMKHAILICGDKALAEKPSPRWGFQRRFSCRLKQSNKQSGVEMFRMFLRLKKTPFHEIPIYSLSFMKVCEGLWYLMIVQRSLIETQKSMVFELRGVPWSYRTWSRCTSTTSRRRNPMRISPTYHPPSLSIGIAWDMSWYVTKNIILFWVCLKWGIPPSIHPAVESRKWWLANGFRE